MTDTLTPARLDAYLERIGYAGPLDADLATLRGLHRAHVLAIPFENLDVQFGRVPSMEPEAIFAKLVTRRRGGWCFEQNGLFGRVLRTLGFPVQRLAGGVMRHVAGDQAMGNHLTLKVLTEGEAWLADVGFGSTQLEPFALAEQAWSAVPLSGTIARTEDGYWRLAIDTGPMPLSFDFRDAPAEEDLLQGKCAWLASDPESIFVQNLAVQLRRPQGHAMLRGKVLTEAGPAGMTNRELASAEELVAVLRGEFGLDVPEAAGLWPQIEARHAALFDSPG